jgi:hypothetical protein
MEDDETDVTQLQLDSSSVLWRLKLGPAAVCRRSARLRGPKVGLSESPTAELSDLFHHLVILAQKFLVL